MTQEGAPPVGAAVASDSTTARRGGSSRPVRLASLALAIVTAALVLALAVAPPATKLGADTPLMGKLAPAVTAQTISGQRFTLASLHGHFAVVDFFASWCPPCQLEQPQLERFVSDNRGRGGARLVGVIFSDSVGNVIGFLGPALGQYPVIADPTGVIATSFGVGNPPTKFVIDPKGRIIAKILGAVTADGLERLISEARTRGE